MELLQVREGSSGHWRPLFIFTCRRRPVFDAPSFSLSDDVPARRGRGGTSAVAVARAAQAPAGTQCERAAAESNSNERTDELRKLDYERQCYRHAEMIARGRLDRLQDSVAKTIRAVKRSDGSAL